MRILPRAQGNRSRHDHLRPFIRASSVVLCMFLLGGIVGGLQTYSAISSGDVWFGAGGRPVSPEAMWNGLVLCVAVATIAAVTLPLWLVFWRKRLGEH